MQPGFLTFRTLGDQLILLFTLLCTAVATVWLTAAEFSFPFALILDQHGNPNAFFGLLWLFLLIAALLRPLLWRRRAACPPLQLISLLAAAVISYLCGWAGTCISLVWMSRFMLLPR